MPTIGAVLFDADGVLQHVSHDWMEALDAVGGPGFAQVVFDHELPAMRGEATMRECLERAATAFDATIDIDELLQLWHRFTVDEAALAVVADVRAAGVSVYFATNQQDVRRDVMRKRYAGVFDGSFYSCEVGAAKPSSEFFARVIAAIGRREKTVLFIDDSKRNVEAARAYRLTAVWHDPNAGAEGLRDELLAARVLSSRPSNRRKTGG